MRDLLYVEKSKFYIVTAVRSMLYTGFLAVVFTSSFLTFRLLCLPLGSTLTLSAAEESTSNHPTSIPWINDEYRCEDTGRTWRKDQCWDYEHDSSF